MQCSAQLQNAYRIEQVRRVYSYWEYQNKTSLVFISKHHYTNVKNFANPVPFVAHDT